jgi:hypothetical protein
MIYENRKHNGFIKKGFANPTNQNHSKDSPKQKTI